MSTIDEKRAAFHQYLASSGVISALSKALIKLYEEPNKPDDPVNFVRRHMGSEDFFILGDGKVTREQNAEEALVLSSLIEKKSEEIADGNVEVENGTSVIENTEIVNEDGDATESEDTGAATVDVNVIVLEGAEEAIVDGNVDTNVDVNVDVLEEAEAAGEVIVTEVALLNAGFEKLKSNADCSSILKTYLTDEIFEKLKTENIDDAIALYNCIHASFENPDAVLGIYATNLQYYDQLSDIFDPIIEALHGFEKESVQPDCDWGDSSVFEPFDENNDVVTSIRICCVRNVQNYPVVCKMEETDLNDSLAKIKAIIEGFEDSSKGTFYDMANVTEDQETELRSIGAFMENSDKYLSSANIYQQWPIGRGVFVADDKSMIIQINAEDHCKFISAESGKHFGKIYQRLVDTVNLFELTFARHNRLGWLTFSPSNLGTALNISVDLKLSKLHSDAGKLQDIIKASPIQLKLAEDEAEGTYTLYNQSTMGSSEFDLTKQFYDIIRTIVECESSVE